MSKALARWRIATNAFSKPSTSSANGLNLQRALAVHGHRHHRSRQYSTVHEQIQPYSERVDSSHSGAAALNSLPDLHQLATHLNETFAPLQFPPELAARILTHQSHRDSTISNNNRLSFIGRRVLNTYLLLFLHSSPEAQASHDYELLAENALNTYVLGEHVGPKWGLPAIMKWRPVNVSESVNTREPSRLGRDTSRSVGLYKVTGTTVEAVVGGVFHQFGGHIAHRLFHTRLLPHILLPGQRNGLHDSFHSHALQICREMGGPQGSLIDATQPVEGSLDSTS